MPRVHTLHQGMQALGILAGSEQLRRNSVVHQMLLVTPTQTTCVLPMLSVSVGVSQCRERLAQMMVKGSSTWSPVAGLKLSAPG